MSDYMLICVDPADDGPFLTIAPGTLAQCEARLIELLALARKLKLRVVPGRALTEASIHRRAPVADRGQGAALYLAIVTDDGAEAMDTLRATLRYMAS